AAKAQEARRGSRARPERDAGAHRLARVLLGQDRAQDERARLCLDVARRRGALVAEALGEGLRIGHGAGLPCVLVIDERFARAVPRPGRAPGWPLAVPGAVRASIEQAAALEGGVPEVLAAHYLDRMPAALVEQLWGSADPLLWRRLDAAPRLRAALA